MGCFYSFKDDYTNAILHLTKTNNYITRYFGEKNPQHLIDAWFSDLFWASVFHQLTFALVQTKDFHAAKNVSLEGIKYSSAVKNNELLELFGKRYLSAAFGIDEYEEACLTYQRYLLNIIFSDDFKYFINKYCK